MEKLEISQCLHSITVESFRKGIKKDMELIHTTPHSLDVLYKEAQKFVNAKRNMKSTKATISKPFEKPNMSKGVDERKPFLDRCPNPPCFKPKITPRGRLRTYERA